MAKDKILMSVKTLLQNGYKYESSVPVSVRLYVKVLDDSSVFGDQVIMRGEQFVPPVGLRFKLFALAPKGHLGQTKTVQRLKMNWWWSGTDHDVRQWVEKCPVCHESEN